MSNTPFFRTECPSCGAPVKARSATAVTLVCGHCNSMLVRRDDSLIDTGRDSALLEDFSPLQIGTQGIFANQRFTLAGRLQVHYSSGLWNEWYALFDDGTAGWLSEAGDLYVMTKPAEIGALPRFKDIRAGFSELAFNGKQYTASDVRSVKLKHTAAQGELPFVLNRDKQSKVADWRCENLFITTDYGSEPPEAFFGRMVKLDELKLERTRSEDEIRHKAGRLKGSIASENCPSCGSSVHWVSGLTANICCPSCCSELAVGEDKAELITANNKRNVQEGLFTLPVGSQGRLRNRDYHVIGAIRYTELEAQTAFDHLFNGISRTQYPRGEWTEYLLYNPLHGFSWLVESDEGWSISQTLNDWPRLDSNRQPQGYNKLIDYGGRVELAVGAFYWRVRSGDVNYYSDYGTQGNISNQKICAELSKYEMAWSKSTKILHKEIHGAFSLPDAVLPPEGISLHLRLLMFSILVVINLPAWLMMDSDQLSDESGVPSIIGMAFILFLGNDSDDDDD